MFFLFLSVVIFIKYLINRKISNKNHTMQNYLKVKLFAIRGLFIWPQNNFVVLTKYLVKPSQIIPSQKRKHIVVKLSFSSFIVIETIEIYFIDNGPFLSTD